MTDKPKPRRSSVQKRVSVPTRLELLVNGELKVEDLTDDEIARQQLMNKDGDFRGRPPSWVPREFAVAMQQEFARRFDAKMGEMLAEAQRAHLELLKSRHLAPGDGTRMQAVKEVYDRTRGKVVQQAETHIVLDKGKTFEDFVGEAIIDLPDDDDLDAIEG